MSGMPVESGISGAPSAVASESPSAVRTQAKSGASKTFRDGPGTAISVVQAAVSESATSTTLSGSITPRSPGSTILVIVILGNTGSTLQCAGTANGAYIAAGKVTGASHSVWAFYMPSASGATESITVSFPAGPTGGAIAMIEVAGAYSMSGAPGQSQAAPGTGKNVLTTGSTVPSSQPGIMVAVFADDSGNDIDAISSPGDGFASVKTFWSNGGLQFNNARIESANIRSRNPIAATMSLTGGGSDSFVSAGFILTGNDIPNKTYPSPVDPAQTAMMGAGF